MFNIIDELKSIIEKAQACIASLENVEQAADPVGPVGAEDGPKSEGE